MGDNLFSTVPNRFEASGFRCQLSFQDLRSLCPLSHLQDSYDIIVKYIPKSLLIEIDSFQEYLSRYAKREIFQEELMNSIVSHIVLSIHPKWLYVELKTNIRRGLHNTVAQEWSEAIGYVSASELGERIDLKNILKIEVLFKSNTHARIAVISGGRKDLATPTFFPAISSHQSFDLKSLLNLLLSEKYPRLYISAYDIYEQPDVYDTQVLLAINRNYLDGCNVIVDSGCFESYHKRDSKWSQGKYKDAISRLKCDYYMAFDPFPQLNQSNDQYYKELTSQLNVSKNIQGKESNMVAILHGIDQTCLLNNVKQFVAEFKGKYPIIAIPERECGDSLSQRCNTIKDIARILSDLDVSPILHILGCGDPLSISAYVYCGADSFDSTDWTRHVIDPNDLRMYGISQVELIKCDCEACKMEKADSYRKPLMHNLLFYQNFMIKIQNMIKYGTLKDFLITTIGKDIVNKIDES